jgi:hypothetical protein
MASALGLSLRASAPCFDRGFSALYAKAAMARVFGAAAIFLCCLLLGVTPGRADPASTAAPDRSVGLVQPFEIDKIVRDAGFIPQGPPRREGTTYVLHAIDHREVLMRVVVDARSGAIHAVNRMVPARPSGVAGVMPPDGAHGPRRPLPGPLLGSPPRDASPGDAMPADISGPPTRPKEADLSAPPPLTMRPGTLPLGVPPLPRPRPSNLTVQKAKPPAAAAPRRAPTTPNGVPQIATPD